METVYSMSADATCDRMESVLWEQGNKSREFNTAALLDPLAWPGLQKLLKDYAVESLALFSGYTDRAHAEIMPRCVMLSPSCPLTPRLAHSLPEHGALFLRWEVARKKALRMRPPGLPAPTVLGFPMAVESGSAGMTR